MAEIMGIAAAAIGILNTGAKASVRLRQTFKTWINAPEELLALHNEVEDLRVVINQISIAGTAVEAVSQQDATFTKALREQIDKAGVYLESLELLLDDISKIKKYKKRYRWVRQEGKVELRKGQFRNVRERIQALLVAHNVTKSTRIELELLSVQTTKAQERDNIATRLEQVATISDNTHQEITAIRSDLQMLTSSITEVERKTQQLSSSIENIERMVINTHAEIPQIGQHVGRFASQIDRNIERLTAQNPKSGRKSGIDLISRAQFRSTQAVCFTTAGGSLCPPDCGCQCHSNPSVRNQLRLPRRLTPLLGLLFIRYTGCPGRGALCDSAECHERRGIRIEATYTFPLWFLWYTIYILYQSTRGRKPELLLTVKNRVSPDSSPLFNACFTGDTQLVAQICRTTPWRVRDVYFKDGCPPLTLAIVQNYVDIVKLLLDAGANPDHEDDSGRSDRALAAGMALSRRLDMHSGICAAMNIAQYVAELDLPQLTRTTLQRPGSMSVEDYIRRHPSESIAELNDNDEFGRTPLHWACAIGDPNAVQALLQLGADPNQQSSQGTSTPLQLAAEAGTGAGCIDLLCEAGVSLKRDLHGRTPLHYACHVGTVEAAKILVRSGAPIEDAGEWGRTPLHCAAYGNNFTVLEYLLQIGANMESQDFSADTPLANAVRYNAHECADRLLSRSCNPLCINNDRATILHIAAEHSDVHMLRILARHDLSRLDILAKQKSGLTAQTVFDKRGAKPGGLAEAFRELLATIV